MPSCSAELNRPAEMGYVSGGGDRASDKPQDQPRKLQEGPRANTVEAQARECRRARIESNHKIRNGHLQYDLHLIYLKTTHYAFNRVFVFHRKTHTRHNKGRGDLQSTAQRSNESSSWPCSLLGFARFCNLLGSVLCHWGSLLYIF